MSEKISIIFSSLAIAASIGVTICLIILRNDVLSEITNYRDEVAMQVTALTDDQYPSPLALEPDGATYIRWGKDVCPTRAQLVYGGFWRSREDQGQYDSIRDQLLSRGSQFVCVPYDPDYKSDQKIYVHRSQDKEIKLLPLVFDYSYRSPYLKQMNVDVERYVSIHHHFLSNIKEYQLTCSVCQSSRKSQIMIPDRQSCPSNWTLEYSGFLTKTRYSQNACMDRRPTLAPITQTTNKGFISWLALLFPVQQPTAQPQTRLDFLRVVGVVCDKGISCPTSNQRRKRVVMCVVCSR